MNGITDLLLDLLIIIFNIFIFPGLLAAIFLGGIMSWLNRKVIARFQARRGPPFSQPWSDLIKLLSKEQIIPVTANRIYFYLGPMIALLGPFLICLLFPIRMFDLALISDFKKLLEYGDLILIISLLLFPAVGLIIGGASSGNPFASIGASREGALIIAIELPLAIAILTPAFALIQDGIPGAFSLLVLEGSQNDNLWFIFRFPFAALTLLLCLILKLGIRPFDMSEARQEIVAGPLTEYNGPMLGLFMITKYITWFAFSGLFTYVFLGGSDNLPLPFNIITFLAKCFGFIIVVSVVDAISPRYRIDQAFKVIITSITILSFIDPIILVISTII